MLGNQFRFCISFCALLLAVSTPLCACELCELTDTHGLHGFADQPHPQYAGELDAFRTRGSGWTQTSSSTPSAGESAVITWSIVPDGTSLPQGLGEPSSPSNLIAFLDDLHHQGAGPGGSDLSQRSWWDLIHASFERWEQLSGLTFHYEPEDDGRMLGSIAGVQGVRGDHRLGGHSIDGQISPTFLAYSYFPNNSDLVIDTDEVNRWSNPTNDYLLFRNMLMHEIGHGLGLAHVESVDVDPVRPEHQFGSFLMEPTLASGFDGPQLDDILGIQRLYGDANEILQGNDTSETATILGDVSLGSRLRIGADGDDIFVAPSDTDFVSIDDRFDIDYYKFSIDGPELIDITLTPKGPTYLEGGQGSGNAGTQQPFVSSMRNDLTLTLLDLDGTSVLASSANPGLGIAEMITDHALPTAGDYFVKIEGSQFDVQLYQLDIRVVPEPGTILLLLIAYCIRPQWRGARSSPLKLASCDSFR